MVPDRHSTRLPSFDYGQTCACFISLVVQNRERLFGKIVNCRVELSDVGMIVAEEWRRTPIVRPGIYLDEWIVMPDHFQAILFIDEETHRANGFVGAHRGAPADPLHRNPRTLGSFIAQFKATTTKRINDLRQTLGQRYGSAIITTVSSGMKLS
jgi:putative transposase